jgi:hypothetical protein
MWIAKGMLLALWLFGFGTMALLYFSIYRHLPPNTAVEVSVFSARTIRNRLGGAPSWSVSLSVMRLPDHGLAHWFYGSRCW